MPLRRLLGSRTQPPHRQPELPTRQVKPWLDHPGARLTLLRHRGLNRAVSLSAYGGRGWSEPACISAKAGLPILGIGGFNNISAAFRPVDLIQTGIRG